jgi:hypothetical protein
MSGHVRPLILIYSFIFCFVLVERPIVQRYGDLWQTPYRILSKVERVLSLFVAHYLLFGLVPAFLALTATIKYCNGAALAGRRRQRL